MSFYDVGSILLVEGYPGKTLHVAAKDLGIWGLWYNRKKNI